MTQYRKNDIIELNIIDMSHDGEGIGKTDAFIWFVKDTVIGDRVRAKVVKVGKNYGYARLVDIIEGSPDRVEPPCPIARRCGGCTLQQLRYDNQLAYKEQKVKNNLIRIGGFDKALVASIYEGIVGMEHPYRYRNKAQFPIGKAGDIIAGYYAGRTHDIIACDDCLIGDEINKDIVGAVIGHMKKYDIEPYDETLGTGLVRHVLVRKAYATGDLMCCIVATSMKIPYADELADSLAALGVTNFVININKERTNVILGEKQVCARGDGYITDYIGDIRFRISAKSFYQVNPQQTRILYETAISYAGLSGQEVVWDLYCGIGTISLSMARSARQVIGVEVVEEAIADAIENARINNITNTQFICGRAEDIVQSLPHPDVIVVDPPRKGCDRKCIQTMLDIEPSRIVYVSCDSATLARDLKMLCESGKYELKRVKVVDMFPQTGHVETVVLFSKGEIDSKKVRVEFSLENMDMSGFQKGATYPQIKEYVQEHSGLKVSSLYISQVKRKCGLDVGQNYNLSKKEDTKQPQCPPEKEKAIMAALKYFGML